jgi:integrase
LASIIKKELDRGIQFQVRYRVNGKQKAKNFTSKGKNVTAIRNAEREANRFIKEIEAQVALGIAKDTSNITFEEYSDFVFTIHDKNAADQTKVGRKAHLKIVNEFIGQVKLKDIDSFKIKTFLIEVSKFKNNPTIRRYKQIINIVLNYAVDDDLISYNPMSKVKFDLSSKTTREVTPVEDDILETYLLQIDIEKYKFLIQLMIYTGMRVGEAIAIKKSDFNFDKMEYYIKNSRLRNGKLGDVKKKKPRKGIIHSALEELYYEIVYWQDQNKSKFEKYYHDNDLLICNEDGSPLLYEAIKSYMQRLDDKTGIKIRPHQMRHTFISNLILKNEMNPKEVQLLAGHAKVQTTLNTYTKLFGGKFEESTREKLEELYANRYKKEGL